MIPENWTKMKLPYFFQQLLGFLAVIIILMTITVVYLVHFGRHTAFGEIERRLFGYAESIVEQNLDSEELDTIHEVLGKQGVSFYVFEEEGRLIYPELPPHLEARVVPEEFQQLENGERLALTTEQEDMLGNPSETAFIYMPFFRQSTEDFAGFITVSAPISQVDRQMSELYGNVFDAFFLSTAVAIIMSIIFAHYQVKRVNRLRKAAHQVAEGEYTIQLEHKGRDEIDYLSKDFNRMVNALKETSEEVARQEERRKTFMQDAAHEMRTPLTTVNGLLEGLEYNVIPEEQKLRSIQLMRKETRRLIRLVNENMDYENIRSNRIILNKNNIPVTEIFEEIKEQLKEMVEDSTNTMTFEAADDLSVYADYDRLKQILVNLIKNAMQFTTDGEIIIRGQRTHTGTRLSVIDTGIGMTEDELRFIWDRYYKADTSRVNTKYGESGLGLAIVQQLIEMHQATIDVDSEPNKGTSFHLDFPFKVSE